MKRIMTAAAALLAATGFAGTAQAQDNGPAGTLQVKVLATGVLPDGKISEVKVDAIGLPAGTDTTANDNFVPTVAVEYFFSNNFSVETICCLTTHHVTGTGAIDGAEIADHVMILPATVTLKAHVDLGGGIKPYVGAGPTLFFFIDEKPGATAQLLGADSLKIDDTFGIALQAGVDIPVGEKLGVSLDAKRYFLKPVTHFYAGTTEALSTKHDLDPWVISGGVYFRF